MAAVDPVPSHRWVAAAAMAVLLAMAGTACGDDGAEPGAAATTASAPATDASAPTGDGAGTDPTPGTEAPSGPTAYTDTAADAANELKSAWEDDDRGRAAAIAPAEVVEALFPVPAGGFEVYGCDTGEFDTSTCNFRNRATGAYITVTMARHDQGWQVAGIFVDGA